MANTQEPVASLDELLAEVGSIPALVMRLQTQTRAAESARRERRGLGDSLQEQIDITESQTRRWHAESRAAASKLAELQYGQAGLLVEREKSARVGTALEQAGNLRKAELADTLQFRSATAVAFARLFAEQQVQLERVVECAETRVADVEAELEATRRGSMVTSSRLKNPTPIGNTESLREQLLAAQATVAGLGMNKAELGSKLDLVGGQRLGLLLSHDRQDCREENALSLDKLQSELTAAQKELAALEMAQKELAGGWLDLNL